MPGLTLVSAGKIKNMERSQSFTDRLKGLRKDPDAPKNFGQPLSQADGKTVDLYLYDVIGWPWIEAQDIVDAVPKDVTEINLHINSPGGSVFEGTAIYNWLSNHSATINTYIDGLAASMASVIAMVGKTITMPKSAFYMIHDPWAFMIGSADDLRKEADLLEKIEGVMAEIYAGRTGQGLDQVREWMHKETWFTGAEAVEVGFADSVQDGQGDQSARATFDLSIFDRAPDSGSENTAKQPILGRVASAHGNINNHDTEENIMNPELRKLLEAKGLAQAATDEQAQQFMQNLLAKGDLSGDDLDKIKSEAAKAEKKRAKEIRKACRIARLDDGFADDLIDQDISLEAAREKIFAKMEDTNPPVGAGAIQSGETEIEKFNAAAADSLVMRSGIKIKDPAPGATQLRAYEMTQIVKDSLARSGVSVGHLNSRRAIADFVFNSRHMTMTTADFPEIFRDAANKILQNAYEVQPATYQRWTGRSAAPDLKNIYGIALSEAPELDLLQEAEEYKYGAFKEKQENYRVYKYGKKVKLTMEMLINDDMRAFARLPRMMGASAKRKENTLVYAHLTSGGSNHGPTMNETSRQLFNDTDGNLLQTGRAITADNLDAGRRLMRAQKGLNGVRLNIVPRFLIVSSVNEMTTDVLLTSSGNVTAEMNAGVVNPMRGRFESIVEDYLLDYFNSGLGWYLAADPDQMDTIEVSFLEGYEQPQVVEKEDFHTDSIDWKVRHFFGVGAMDFRGLVLNDGTA